ncbi:MAG: Amuc_1100 family pilus-like protein [Verrucomicrobiae bacterium]|nr:Amuc_1100 family pilus-like protein [Verrucomicrobiae bacterium]
MKFIQQNAVLLLIFSVFLLLLGGSCWLLKMKVNESNAVKIQLEDKRNLRASLLGSAPFPREDNINAVRKQTELENKLLDKALSILVTESVEFEEMDSLQFSKELITTRLKMSEDLRDKGVKLGDNNFQFGFDRYERMPARREFTPMLKKQLQVVQELMSICAANRLFEIKSVRRVEFEEQALALMTSAAGGRSGSGRGTPPPPAFKPTGPLISTGGRLEMVDAPGYLYSTMPFELKVVAEAETFRSFLNDLCHSKFIFLPRLVLIENEKKEPLAANIKTAIPGSGGGAPPTGVFPMPSQPRGNTPGAGKKPTPDGMPEINRAIDPSKLPNVLGDERITVTMIVEWLAFRTDLTPKTAGKAKSAKGQERQQYRK